MKRILVGIDGSSRMHEVLDAAITLARSLHAQLVLLRAVQGPDHVPANVLAASPEEITRLVEQRAKAELEKLVHRLPPEMSGGTCVVSGSPWRAICVTARELDVDLIFVGTYTHDALDRVLGSTASRVVAHADRSVLVHRLVERRA